MKKIVIINATASKTSGALTVLKDFVLFVEKNPAPDKQYHLFTVIDEFDHLQYIQVHKLTQQNWLSRIYWDNGGLQKWCKKNNLESDAIISLQNTSTKYKNKDGLMVVQVVYYHQPIPLYQWDGLMGCSLKMLLYRYFYPIFVNKNNQNTHYVVQLPYIKELFCKKFTNILSDRVTVVCPNNPSIDINHIPEKIFDSDNDKFYFIYPATMLGYKNHIILISALAILKEKYPDLFNKIVIFFTVDQLPKQLTHIITLNNLGGCIQLIGQISYTEILSYYKSVGALLFPSKIESFGLPLLEASCFGLPIIAANLPYAKEVLQSYKNALFVDSNNPNAWASAIGNYKEYHKINPGNITTTSNTWGKFIGLVDQLIKGKQYDQVHQ